MDTEHDPPGLEKAKPRFFSVAWRKNLFSALNLRRYNARDWAIWSLASNVMLMKVSAAAWVNIKMPWLWPFLKGVGVKVSVAAGAFWEAVTVGSNVV